jgi:hypothetical protein
MTFSRRFQDEYFFSLSDIPFFALRLFVPRH